MTIPGLTNGQNYTVSIKVIHSDGSVELSNSLSGKPQAAASAPVIKDVIAGDGTITINFFAPTDTGGYEITNYEFSLNSGTTWTARYPASTISPIILTGLENKKTYNVKIRAITNFGVGETQPASIPATPAHIDTVPSSPQIISFVASKSSIDPNYGEGTLTIALPESDGGLPIYGYEYRLDSNDYIFVAPDFKYVATQQKYLADVSIGQLTYGQDHAIAVRALNDLGASTESLKTINVTIPPRAVEITSYSVSSGQTSLVIANGTQYVGNSPITNYKYSLDGGTTWTTRTPASIGMPLTITGLNNGTTYSVVVRAVNTAGESQNSAPQAIKVLSTPSVPILLSYKIEHQEGLSIDSDVYTLKAFYKIESDGGSDITGFMFSFDAGATWNTWNPAFGGEITSTYISLNTALITLGGTYNLKIRLINALGVGGENILALKCFVALPPGPPAQLDILEPDEGIRVIIHPPTRHRGAQITNYQYSIDAGKNWITRTPASAYEYLQIPVKYVADPSRSVTLGIRAINSLGAGTPLISNNPIVNTGVPPPPDIIAWQPITSCDNTFSSVQYDSVTIGYIDSRTIRITGLKIKYSPIHQDIDYQALQSYRVQYSIDGGTWTTTPDDGGYIPTAGLGDLDWGTLVVPLTAEATTYGVRVRLSNPYGDGVESESLRFKILQPSHYDVFLPPSPTGTPYSYTDGECTRSIITPIVATMVDATATSIAVDWLRP